MSDYDYRFGFLGLTLILFGVSCQLSRIATALERLARWYEKRENRP
jgi:hypothetical protein